MCANSDIIKVTFYFTRHGHAHSNFITDSSDSIIPWNLLTIGKNAKNSLLSDLGIGRTINVGKQLLDILPQNYALLSSPLKRALLTAHFQYNIYRKNYNNSIHVIPYINEIYNWGSYEIIKNMGIDTNSHNEYDLDDVWYKKNPYNINFDLGNERSIKILKESMFYPEPEKFFCYFLKNFKDYAKEAMDINGKDYNFVIVSHGNYLKSFFEYLDIKEGIPEKIENNSVFKLEMNFDKRYFFEKVERTRLINCVDKFDDLTKFNKKIYDIEKFENKDIFSSCHFDNGKSINKYIKNIKHIQEYDIINKILLHIIRNMKIKGDIFERARIRTDYYKFLIGDANIY
jgi:broad specificity phosphatase PhoE